MRYAFDRAARELAASLEVGVLAGRGALPGPITRVVFFLHQTAITPWEAWVYTTDPERVPYRIADGSCELRVACAHSCGAIPRTVDDDLPVLEAFHQAHGLRWDPDEDASAIEWYDGGLGLPCAMYFLELMLALGAARERLADAGVAWAPGAVIAFEDEDREGFHTGEDPAWWAAEIRERLREVPFPSGDALRAWAALCYDDPARQGWLIALAGAAPADG